MSQHLFTEKDTYDSIINVEANGTSPRLQVEPAASDNLFRDASAQGLEDNDPFVIVSHHIKSDITQELGDGRIRLAHFNGAFFGAVFNLSNATVGTGVLGMELVFLFPLILKYLTFKGFHSCSGRWDWYWVCFSLWRLH